MALDFSLLGQGPQFQNVLASYQAGAEQQKATQTKNALSMYSTDPEGAINALNKVDPVMALKLRDDQRSQALASQKKAVFQETDPTKRMDMATQTGDPDTIATVNKLDDSQLAHAKAANEALGSVAYGLRTKVPYDQRKAQIAQIAPALAATGMKPEEIQAFDPTDQNLDALIGKAQSLHDQLDQADKDRTFKMTSEDKATDNKRADLLANNTISTDRARLGLEGQRVAIERSKANGENGGIGTGGVAPSAVHGDDFLKSLPADQAAQVKALATGRMAFPTGTALKAPYWQQMLQSVANYDPNFDAVNYNARAKTRGDFTAGKSAQNIKALNTAIGHLGRLDDQIGGTASTQGYPGATTVNKGMNALSRSMGDSGVTNYEQTASALSTELTAVFRGSGGAEADVKRYLDQLNSNASAKQKKDAVKNISSLLHSRLEALGDQYQQGMGTTGDKLQLLNPEAQKVVDRINVTPPTNGKRPPLSAFQK